MKNHCEAGAVVYAKDLKRMSHFYAEVLGLETRHEEQDHAVLESSTFQLVVVAMPQRLAQQIEVASPPVRREDTAIKLWFLVPSLAEVRLRAAELGGGLKGPGREWQFNGRRVCDGHDPEGNVFQVRENVL